MPKTGIALWFLSLVGAHIGAIVGVDVGFQLYERTDGKEAAMAFCRTCGEALEEGAEVCPVCGTKVGEKPSGAPAGSFGTRTRDEWLVGNAQSAGITPGYSKKFDTPEFQAALKAGNSSYTRLLLITLLVLPPVVMLIVSLFRRDLGVGLLFGGTIVVYAIEIPVIAFFLIRRNTAKPWDGEVVDLEHRTSDESADRYYIICRTNEGKKRKVADFGHSMYEYLQVGDRVRFHPRLNVPLEKYDKTRDSFLLCPFCGMRQPLENDDCDKCNKPLLK